MEFLEKYFSTTQIIIMSFLVAILFGACLLCLPVMAADGQATTFMNALFTAVSSVCVVGMQVLNVSTHWSIAGQIVILVMIQIGGLGVITITTTVMVLLGQKISLRNRILLGDAFNLETLNGLVQFLKKVFKGTVMVEGIGALCCLPVFVPQYGLAKGIWISVFHAISSFCNAGIDIIGSDGLMPYVHNVWLNVITMTLVILGGIGFVVWWDVIDMLRKRLDPEVRKWAGFHSLSLQSKMAITMSAALIGFGMLLFFLFEYNNEATIGHFTLGQKLLAALFQSVTTRSGGFATIPQTGLTVPSVIVTILLVFIGGSPVGTAGGMKTTTVAVIFLAVLATVRGQEDVTCFQRRISGKTVRKATAIVLISFTVCLASIIGMLVLEDGNALDTVFEIFNALGTAGLSRDFTQTVGLAGKLLLCFCMFLGRIGPITMVIAFTMKDTQTPVRFPEDSITVG
ncbi:MAG: potassium transporter KtrB [Lachnospiraceae bacterium]|nr:potassium transporter KtrB [Lachnospiraceae bacterium]